ncbi:MAG TPA: SpoIID/LytB domain-containing protein [Planctomycetota bacterium]|nr:SpoIID/LytB domain-containing protein [Planctomycetota bacterium]
MRRPALLLCVLVGCSQPPGRPAAPREPAFAEGREPTIRVALLSLGAWEHVDVTGKGGLAVRERGAQPRATTVAYRVSRTSPPVDLVPAEGVFTVAGRTYAGDLLWDGTRLLNRVSLENYTLGVLRGELPLKRIPPAAAGAQAIAVRSYTLSYVAAGQDLDDTTNFQCYAGMRYAPDDAHLREGVRGTRGMYLSVDRRPLRAYYHSTCGGHTTDVPTGLDREPSPAMRGVSCPYCQGARYFRWSTKLDAAPVLKAAALEGPLQRVDVVEKDAGGRARLVRVTAGGHEKVMRASAFRLSVGPSALRSTYLLGIAMESGAVKIEGGGWGHGVGLCQCGAIGLADLGKTAQEIAAYYYPGAALRRAY